MAQSRSTIELVDKASAMISLRNVLSILFLERIPHTIRARSYSTLWRDHEKAGYMPASKSVTVIDTFILQTRAGTYKPVKQLF